MMRLSNKILLVSSIILFFSVVAVFAEDVTITTYYPSPYGSYSSLFTDKLGVGDNNGDGIFTNADVPGTSGDVWIKGNVSIGTTAASGAKLNVAGTISANIAVGGVLGTVTKWHTMGGTNFIGDDIAELIDSSEEVESADVLIIDEQGSLKKCTEPYDTKVAGIVSAAPAVLFEGATLQIAPKPFEFKKGKKPPLALAGRVKCKVTTQGGPIKIGDLLVTSSKSGHAMRGDENKIKVGMVLGKALEPLASGEGVITVLATLE